MTTILKTLALSDLHSEFGAISKLGQDFINDWLKNWAEENLSILRNHYAHIVIWGVELRSFSSYVDQQIVKAFLDDAPARAIYKEGLTWAVIDDCAIHNRPNYIVNFDREVDQYRENSRNKARGNA